MHEYGHYIDSQRIGLTYLINVGLPSLSTANSSDHDEKWYEMNANKNANKYFNKHYGNRVDWSLYEPPKYTYPRKRKKMSL